MQPVTRFAIVFTVLSTLVLGSARGAPPLDQLPLRDALLARPEVVAELAPEARQRLAQRFEEARKRPQPSAAVLGEPDAQPLDLVRALDLSRLGERKDAVVAAQLVLSPLGVEAREFTDEPTEPQGVLPPLDGVAASTTAEEEAGALQGTAGVVLSRLLRQSEAKRMVRVQSWPVGAIAIRGTVYVNAAWLVAMSPIFREPPPRKDSGDPTKPKDPTGGGITAKPPGAPADGQSVEAGCGGSVGSAPSSGTPAPASRERAPESTESTSESGDSANQTIATSAPGRGPINLPLRTGSEEPGERGGGSGFQTLWNGTRTAGAGTGEGTVESLTYALDNGSGAPVDCCRYNSERGCDTTTPCDTPSNSCNSSGDSGGCSGDSGGCSGNGSGCSSGSGSGCSSGSGSGCSSGSGSGCSSGSGSGGGCSSGSSGGSGCSSGSSGSSGCSSGGSSGGSCSSGSSGSSCGGSSGSSCGGGGSCGSSGSCGKCTAVPVRPSGDIPDPVTLLFLMAPLGFLLLEGRRRRA